MSNIMQILNNTFVEVCQILAIIVISIGIIKALIILIRDALLVGKTTIAIPESRIEPGHSFSLGLGFFDWEQYFANNACPDLARYRSAGNNHRYPYVFKLLSFNGNCKIRQYKFTLPDKRQG
ncbi:MAG: hypothetical protein P9M03_06445 [Candidatus Theseobacter exili]|nr:hypothetical protein [Candidatus Theseobacter exili]